MEFIKNHSKTLVKAASIAFSAMGACSQIMTYLNYSLSYVAPICFVISFTLIMIFINMKKTIHEKIDELFKHSTIEEMETIQTVINDRLSYDRSTINTHLPNELISNA